MLNTVNTGGSLSTCIVKMEGEVKGQRQSQSCLSSLLHPAALFETWESLRILGIGYHILKA